MWLSPLDLVDASYNSLESHCLAERPVAKVFRMRAITRVEVHDQVKEAIGYIRACPPSKSAASEYLLPAIETIAKYLVTHDSLHGEQQQDILSEL